jgi:hypothetical protein
MFRYFKELYLTWFILGFRVSVNSWSSGMNAGKGVLGVTLISGAIIMGGELWIELLVGTRFSFHTNPWTIRIAALALYFVNYYVLVTRNYGIKFEREFTHLQKSRKVLLHVSCAVLLLSIIAFIIYSVSVYQHLFHIIPKGGK